MNHLKSSPVSEPWQVEIMRHIYNDNLDMLATKPIPHQSYEGQQAWWSANKDKVRAFLYEPLDRPGKFVAFLALTDRGGFCTPIIALQKEEWNRGYGRELIGDYIEKANGPLAGSQLQSNGAICHLNRKVGWKIIGENMQPNGKVDLLYHPGVNSGQSDQKHVFETILRFHGLNKDEYERSNFEPKSG